MKLWGGRFQKPTDERVDEFNASIGFDKVLAEVDIIGSLAHVSMLAKGEVISDREANALTTGLQDLLKKVQAGDVVFRVEDEDIHMNVERMLHELIGPVAGKLHTGRSRNDQVALDMHLFLRENVLSLIEKLHTLKKQLLLKAQQHIDTILPGYTHLQRAQPIRLAQHLLAYLNMFDRDIQRLQDGFARINLSPLGAGAIAGTSFATDREHVAALLGFDGIYENSMDAVSDRDFVVEFLSTAALTMMHLSRLSEELILWCSREFAFIELDDAFTTGSSMMPQKKNPDVAELVRGKTGRVYGALIGMLTLLKGLPLTYNKDMQEDKEGMFDTLKTLHDSLDLYAPMIASMRVNVDTMRAAAEQDFSNATEIADYLVRKNLPFREAHAVSGRLVAHCLAEGQLLNDLSMATYQEFSPLFAEDVYDVIALDAVVDARHSRGGTAKTSVEFQLQQQAERLKQGAAWLKDCRARVTLNIPLS